MREATKQAIRRWLLHQAREILWRVDDWIYKHEQRLQGVAVPVRVEPARNAEPERADLPCAGPRPDEFGTRRVSGRVPRRNQSQRATPAQVSWAQIKSENTRRRAAGQRPTWMQL